MRRPLPEIPQQALLSLRLGVQFENLLLPEKIDRERRANGEGNQARLHLVQIARHPGEKKCVTHLVKLDECLALLGVQRRIIVRQVFYAAFQEGVFVEKFHNAEAVAADRENIQAPVVVAFRDFQDFGAGADPYATIRESQQHAEGALGVKAFADHATVTRLEDVQGERFARKENDVERK